MPEPEYERRVFVKGDAEQTCAAVQQEVALRWSGWRPADEPPPPAPGDQRAEDSAGSPDGGQAEQQPALKRTRTKPE